jgi:hypothetical protein
MSLCIDQTNQVDKMTQVGQMGSIYAAAQATLSLPRQVAIQPMVCPASSRTGLVYKSK